MRRSTLLAFLLTAAIASPAIAQDERANEQVAQQVIAITKAQWAAEMANAPPEEILKDVADDYTEFSPPFPTRLDGKDLQVRLSEAFATDVGRTVAAEMANPKVQVYGNVAILSYNYIGLSRSGDGEVEEVLAKSTRVYVRQADGSWKLVHANFARVGDD